MPMTIYLNKEGSFSLCTYVNAQSAKLTLAEPKISEWLIMHQKYRVNAKRVISTALINNTTSNLLYKHAFMVK